jgi:ABC-type branched-subunit amino acid transport system substrate-binding protein
MAGLFWAASCPLTADAAKPGKAAPGSMAEKVTKPNAVFDADKMGDMSDYDPATWVSPTGDTIKIAVFGPFSGPAALNGQYAWLEATWVAHDINKRGGILVDGKKKLIEMIKADTMSKPDQCKKIAERMVLQEKAHILWGTPGSNMVKILNEVANKYKVICHNVHGLADELQDAPNFSRYAFMTATATSQVGRGLAYYYGQIRKKEKKFYILCQDYNFGHEIAAGFKQGPKEYYPEAQIVGEDYHKLFLTDFAPYLTKIKASGAEVIYSGDWPPDIDNLVKQAKEFGITAPFANLYMDDANTLHQLGVEKTKGLVHFDQFSMPPPIFNNPGYAKFHKIWNNQWKKWKSPPFNSRNCEHGNQIRTFLMQTYWLMSVLERAKSTDPEKIIKVWEGDTYQYPNGKIVMMRGCDHRSIQDFTVEEYVDPEQQKIAYNMPPYYWFKGAAYPGPGYLIPASKVFPRMDKNHDRCKGKNDWGE